MSALPVHSLRAALLVAALAVVGKSWSFTAAVDWTSILAIVPSSPGLGDADAEVSARAEVAALERCWRVLTAFERYGEWNSFTVGVALGGGGAGSLPSVGDRVALTVALGHPWPLDRALALVHPAIAATTDNGSGVQATAASTTRTTTLDLAFTWTEFDPRARRMCWGMRHRDVGPAFVRAALHRLIHSNRCAELRYSRSPATEGAGTAVTAGSVQVRHTDENVGILAPLVGVLFRGPIELGFAQMTEDLARWIRTGGDVQ
jgi:hypothetical protein